MTEEKQKKSIEDFKWLLRLVAVIFLICAFGITAASAYQKVHQEKIYSSVKIGNIELSKQTIDQAKESLQNNFSEKYSNGFNFVYGDKEVNIPNTYEVIQGVERDILEVDFEKTAERAFWIGRSGSVLRDLKDQVLMLIHAKKLDPIYEIDKEYLRNKLIENFGEFEDLAESAKLDIKIVSKNENQAEIKVIDEKEGIAFDYDRIINELTDQINNFENETVSLELETDYPQIRASETDQALARANEIVKEAKTMTFTYEEDKWQAEWHEYALWFGLEKKEDNVNLTFDEEKFYKFLEPIAEEVDVEAKNARFELQNDKVEEFQVSANGKAIDQEQTYEKLIDNFFNFNSNEIELIVEETEPEVTSENINDMGIKELIGVGESNFSGSPANRRHNIRVGSNKIHGLLIKPDEEFSLTKTLGHIDAAAGYLPELVIKGNRTIPEYGGGLCQVGTTMFRVAINTGLPVTERKPHSYRVSYYEPAGFDATIYDPSPDVKFINDTGHYILIQTQINGNILRYEFWGTDDGREVEVTHPQIFNITYPGPTKEIESPDLAPGQRRCTERAHNGADAVFYRTITSASGDVEKETWSSTYHPWQAVCLVGPGAESEGEGDGDEGSQDTPQAPETPSVPGTPVE